MTQTQDQNGFLRLFTKICYYSALSLMVYLIGRFAFRQVVSYRRLKHIPGPFWAAFTNLWILRTILKGYSWIEWGHLCGKLGPIIRVGPNELLISDSESIRRMLSVRSLYTRSDLFDSTRFNPSQNNLLSQREDKIHNSIRSMMIAGYSGKENDMLEVTIDKNVQNVVKLINDKYISTSTEFRPMDLAQKAGYFTIDVISELAFGQAFGNLTQDKDMHEFFQAFDAMMPALTVLSIYPEFCKIMRANWVMKYILPSEKDPAGFGKIIGLAKRVVAERYGPNKKEQRDMLGSFVRHGLTQERAESEVLLQLGAGSDTVATAIRSTFLYIISSPSIYITLKSEINNAAKNHLISSPIQDFEAKTMPYLQACIKEGLRMWPPDAGASYRLSPPEGDTICGKFIPGNTKVGICFYGALRNKEIYGVDAEIFNPKRWLDAKGEKLDRMERTNQLVFAPGKWQCLGMSIAFMELNKIFVELLRHFDFELVDPSNPWKSLNYGLFLQSDLFVKVTKSTDIL